MVYSNLQFKSLVFFYDTMQIDAEDHNHNDVFHDDMETMEHPSSHANHADTKS